MSFVKKTLDLSRIELTCLRFICEAYPTPYALSVLHSITEAEGDRNCLGDPQRILGRVVSSLPSVDPASYGNVFAFRTDYLISKVVSKTRSVSSEEAQRRALTTWSECEARCAATNESLRHPDADTGNLIVSVRCQIDKILGPLRNSDIKTVSREARFGPGSTLTTKGAISRGMKYEPEIITISRRALTWFTFDSSCNRFRGFKPELAIVESDALTFVPKTLKTDRPISINPHINVWFQLGVGALLRSRLKSSGLDLDSQADVNRSRLSHPGIATIDLSSASDTVAYELVSRVLTDEWFELLLAFRMDNTTMPNGEVVPLEKFSAMGNGYTFELESLIFLAICRAIVPASRHDEISVFGDDIIVPSEYGEGVLRALKQLGFVPNTDKTFLSGNFFESCGVDVFYGVNVRPFFFKRDPKANDVNSTLFLYANLVSAYASQHGDEDQLRTVYGFLVSLLPKELRECYTTELDDRGLLLKTRARFKRVDGILRYKQFVAVQPKTSRFKLGQYFASLHQGSENTLGLDPIRLKKVPKYQVRWFPRLARGHYSPSS